MALVAIVSAAIWTLRAFLPRVLIVKGAAEMIMKFVQPAVALMAAAQMSGPILIMVCLAAMARLAILAIVPMLVMMSMALVVPLFGVRAILVVCEIGEGNVQCEMLLQLWCRHVNQ